MQIITKDIIFNFEKSSLDNKTWDSTINFLGFKITFEFDETLFLNTKSDSRVIDWELITQFINNVLENIESIQKKGSAVLSELHRQVFPKDELIRTDGYFEVELFRLEKFYKESHHYHFQYEVYYFLESRKDFLMDVYHHYYATFSNHNGLTLVGIKRLG